MFIIKLLL